MRADLLGKIGEELQAAVEADKKKGSTRASRRKNANLFLKFEKHYWLLKKDCQLLITAYRLKGGNPLIPIGKLVLGICALVVSLAWVIHICIYILPNKPADPFLNTFFITLENVGQGYFPLFGILAYAIFSLYLLWCVVKGNFKMGIRFFCWKIYPMEVGNTMMNAFLVNAGLILLCSIPAVQFCVIAFPVYARFSEIDMLFGTQVRYLTFFHYFWDSNVFIIAMLCIVGLSLIVAIVFPTDIARNIDKELERISNDPEREFKVQLTGTNNGRA